MAFCGKCGAYIGEDRGFCPECGAAATSSSSDMGSYLLTSDHTADYTPKDISKNKAWAMIAYLFGPLGMILALVAGLKSPFARFHATQAAKIYIVFFLGDLVLLASFSIIVAVSYNVNGVYGPAVVTPLLVIFSIYGLLFFVLLLVCFVYVCLGKAKDAPIVGRMSFLK